MFTGDFTQKKKVDLGGRRKELDRSRLLEQAKADRERRAREKLERVSATKIQVCAPNSSPCTRNAAVLLSSCAFSQMLRGDGREAF